MAPHCAHTPFPLDSRCSAAAQRKGKGGSNSNNNAHGLFSPITTRAYDSNRKTLHRSGVGSMPQLRGGDNNNNKTLPALQRPKTTANAQKSPLRVRLAPDNARHKLLFHRPKRITDSQVLRESEHARELAQEGREAGLNLREWLPDTRFISMGMDLNKHVMNRDHVVKDKVPNAACPCV